MQKLHKNNKGFTLVEVIVVAVIVLILAAVAIPLYNGYIDDSRRASAENVAGSMASAFGAAEQMGWGYATVSNAGTAVGTVIVAPQGGQSNVIVIPRNMSVYAASASSTIEVRVPFEGTRQVTATVQWKHANATVAPPL